MTLKKIVLLLPALFICYGAEAMHAMTTDEEKPSRILEIEWLKEEIYAINIINQLDLTANQIEVILKRAELARPFIAACRESLPDILFDQLEAFKALKVEDEANQGFSIQVEKHASTTNNREKDLGYKLIRRLNEISRPLFEVLTVEQLERIEDYRCVIFPQTIEQAAESGSLAWRIETICETLLEAVRLSDGAFRRDKKRLARRILNAFPRPRGAVKKRKDGDKKKTPGKGLIEGQSPEDQETVEEALARILDVMDMLRTWPVERVEAELDHIIRTRICPPKMAQMKKALHAVERSKNPTLSPLARYLLNPDARSYLEKLKKRSPKGPLIDVQ